MLFNSLVQIVCSCRAGLTYNPYTLRVGVSVLQGVLIPNELQDRVRHLTLSNLHFQSFENHRLLFHIDAFRTTRNFSTQNRLREILNFPSCQQPFSFKCSVLVLGGYRQDQVGNSRLALHVVSFGYSLCSSVVVLCSFFSLPYTPFSTIPSSYSTI